jgi:N-acetylglutamate synthase-like GNAT family acetyltransferase
VISVSLRAATLSDVAALQRLIPLSARTLQVPSYTVEQIEAALGPVFAVDEQLIADQTYFVAEHARAIVGCGGWSKRETLFGRQAASGSGGSRLLDPHVDAARIRAFFVHPSWARHGIGSALVRACETAAMAAGFARMELVATLTGEALYAAFEFNAVERYTIPLPNGLSMPVVRMRKTIATHAK